jgi:endogenous inhibitor of DNA gyrase (YacG/DUF329 family)
MPAANDESDRSPLPCPICKQPVDPASRGLPKSPFPFCSPRCKLIDLGRWLGGTYQIPVVEHDESDPAGDEAPRDEAQR